MPETEEAVGCSRPPLPPSIMTTTTSPVAAFLPFDYDPVELLPPLLEAHLPGLGEHCLRTALLADSLALRLALPAAERFALRLGALYHDAGKLYLPATLLKLERSLTEDELAAVCRHVPFTLRLLAGAPLPIAARDAIAHHHERWDGRGYPLGLAGPRIPRTARILAVADVYDTLTHPRSYGPVLTRGEALDELARSAGSQLDPEVVPLAALFPED